MLVTYLEITSGISLWSSVRILWAWKETKFSIVQPKKPRTFSDFWNWQSVWSLQHNAMSATDYQFHDGYWFHDVKEYVKPQTRELASKRCLNLVFHHILSSSSSLNYYFLSLYNHSVQLQQFEDSIRHFQCVLGLCFPLSFLSPPTQSNLLCLRSSRSKSINQSTNSANKFICLRSSRSKSINQSTNQRIK